MRRGAPAALEDRCCHRTAKLSKGWIRNGNIVCGYHGWEYDPTGKLVNVPQFPFEQPVPDARAKAFRAKARYGYVWVCLARAARRHSRARLTRTTARSAASISSTTPGDARRCG